MTKCVGGTWDGVYRSGYPANTRKLVLFKQLPNGERDLENSETYIRESYGGNWIWAHDGVSVPEDGPWTFPDTR